MALSKKREYNVISGIEDREETNKRIRKYLYKQFKQQPEKLFLEWDKRKIIIENCQSWAFPEPTKKVAIFLNFTTPKIKSAEHVVTKPKPSEETMYEDIDDADLDNDLIYCEGIKNVRILIDVVHSAQEHLKNYCSKKSKTNTKRDNRYYLLMTIHHYDLKTNLPDTPHISDIFKSFNREKIKTSFDQRLCNMLYYIVESIINNEKKYQICVRRDAFFNNHVKDTILPISYEYLSKFYQ